MTTKHLTGAYPAGYALNPVYDALLIKPTASVGGTGVSASALATITNLGTVIATATNSDGVLLQAGGAATNGSAAQTSALIETTNGSNTSGWDVVAGASASVANFGTMDGYRGAYLLNGGTVTNGSYHDTTAMIDVGRYAVLALGAPLSVENFGTVVSSGSTIQIGRMGHPASGATITNGSQGDTAARIQATQVAVWSVYGALTLSNFGTIASSQDAVIFGDGAVTNGSETDRTALINGKSSDGVLAAGSQATVANFATIIAANGVFLDSAGASLTNGSATDRVALAEGYQTGVIDNGGLVTNFGTIEGVGQGRALLGQLGATVDNFGTIMGAQAVDFVDGRDRLVVEAGSSLVGAVVGDGGTLELAAASGTISGLGAGGTISGGQSGTVGGFGSYVFDFGTTWTAAGGASLAAGRSVTLTNHATLQISGAIANAGTIALASSGSATRLIVTAATTLSGGGLVSLSDSAANIIVGATPTTTLTNLETIAGVGLIGEGQLTLINGASGVIDATGSKSSRTLVIDTGTETIANAGLIESTGKGGLIIASAVTGGGTLAVTAGRLTVQGAVTGPGVGVIHGGILDFAASFSGNVSFTGAKGTLELGQSQTYGGTVSGFSRTGGTAFDLADIGFVSSSEASFAHGVLTVTDGSHTARIALIGPYRQVTFVAASDNNGGTLVTALTAPAPPLAGASVAGFASAAASLAGDAGAPIHQTAEGHGQTRLLARPAA